ncbi:MAG: glucosamine-6-phosphate deaminase [Cellulosilyticaceae bacterium]
MQIIKLNNVTVFVVKDYEQLSKQGAQIIADLLETKKDAVLGLATGSTPVGMYEELIRMNKNEKISFKEVHTYNLDEYYPIEKSNHQSYDYFMKEKLFNHVDIKLENTHIPNGMAVSSAQECITYDKKIRDIGGVDIQVLGIGGNGHIGFNEPSEVFQPITHKVQLDQRTIVDNSRFFNSIDEVPTQAITMGIGTIMSAKALLLLANGTKKAVAIKEMLLGKVTPKVQASILQFHKQVIVVVDESAAAELIRALEVK